MLCTRLHLVMRIKLLDDAAVAAESPPSQHELIFDVSQMIRSVRVELQKRTSLIFNPLCFSVCVCVCITWCRRRGRLSGAYSKLKQLSSSLCMTSA